MTFLSAKNTKVQEALMEKHLYKCGHKSLCKQLRSRNICLPRNAKKERRILYTCIDIG
uniref:Uncharacterized protein n=1 Tax=Rhizophora mucronata TaxID=61149 RepID=A0A2P2Q593_RHIMU